MSSREIPHSGDIYGHAQAHVAELKGLYPSQFARAMVSCDWPDGWHDLVRSLCAFAASHTPDVRWTQIKEKYGGLRIYYTGGGFRADLKTPEGLASFLLADEEGPYFPRLQEMIERAEAQSMKTCCLCGVQGEVNTVKRRRVGGWQLTSCDDCEPKIIAGHEHRVRKELEDRK